MCMEGGAKKGGIPTQNDFGPENFGVILVNYIYRTKMMFATIESWDSSLSIGAKINSARSL